MAEKRLYPAQNMLMTLPPVYCYLFWEEKNILPCSEYVDDPTYCLLFPVLGEEYSTFAPPFPNLWYRTHAVSSPDYFMQMTAVTQTLFYPVTGFPMKRTAVTRTAYYPVTGYFRWRDQHPNSLLPGLGASTYIFYLHVYHAYLKIAQNKQVLFYSMYNPLGGCGGRTRTSRPVHATVNCENCLPIPSFFGKFRRILGFVVFDYFDFFSYIKRVLQLKLN